MHQKVIHENARLVPCPVADNNARTGGTFERTNRASPFEPETATRARHPPKLPVFPGIRECRWAPSAVVPKETLWFLMGDTLATQYDEVSPESLVGRLHVTLTVAPQEHLSGGKASGRAGFWHSLRKLFTSDLCQMFQYYLADADLLIQSCANQ